jgi:Protein of unknown function (DUF3307).
MNLLLQLIAWHFICDYVLQTDAIATGKNLKLNKAQYGVDWYYWMTAHAITHSLAVYYLTFDIRLTIFELLAHWWIDYRKCLGKINLHTDQSLHILCKLSYAYVIFSF